MLNMAFLCQLHPHKLSKNKNLIRKLLLKIKNLLEKRTNLIKNLKNLNLKNQMNKNLTRKKLDVSSVVKKVI